MRSRVVLIVATIAMVAAGCSSSKKSAASNPSSTTGSSSVASSSVSQPTGPPFKLLMIMPLTGPLAASAQGEVQTVKAAANTINSRGGILGRPVTVTVQDDQTSSTTAVSLLQEALGSNKPDLVFTGASSNEALAMVQSLTENHILSVTEAGSTELSQASKYPYAFSTSPHPADGATALGHYLSSKGFKKIAVLSANDAYGQSWSAATVETLKGQGFDVSSTSFNPTSLDVTAPLQQLAASKPDTTVVEAFGAPAGYVLQSRSKLGTGAPMIGDLTMSAVDLTKLADKSTFQNLTLQAYKVQQYVPSAQQPQNLRTMVDAIKAIGPITQPINVLGFAWDIVQAVAYAANTAKSLDPATVAKTLENLGSVPNPPWVTYTTFGFSATSHQATMPPENYVFIPPGPLVDGMITSG
jgi:branched-chain amino acid transport system substrate-binding protein